MPIHNRYLAYKHDTSHLVYWVTRTSNDIIRKIAAAGREPPDLLNKSGSATVSQIVSMSNLIAHHIEKVQPLIYRLFRSVISARSAIHAEFLQIVASNPDPEIEKSNASHKHFIDALTEAFEVLGGQTWLANEFQQPNDEQDNIEEILIANKFHALALDKDQGAEDAADQGDSSEEPQSASVSATSSRQNQRSTKKGKKGKHGKKGKNRQRQLPKAVEPITVPLESYKIIEAGDSGLVTEYLMAVYEMLRECIDLRAYVQGIWRDVAYNQLNSAVAGAVSNMAVSMIKRSASAMFVEFPGDDSFDKVMNTITRGNPDKAQGNFHLSLQYMDTSIGTVKKVREVDLDVREQFFIHTFHDLLDFVNDYQTTRSGKPTKRMLAGINNWDPEFDLTRASNADRIKWRRAYIINWLYDLVNVFSAIVVQRNTLKGQHHAYENVDWSIRGPWNEHRRLFGLNEFAGFITSLAMQKPGTDVKSKILVHHVFQLQCIADAWTVSRGWSISGLKGHVIRPPPRNFRPRRDVDLFLDRENQRCGRGILQAVDIVKQLLERDSMLHGQPDRHTMHCKILEDVQYDFVNWLGESKYMYGLQTIPSSRFSNRNANGLWEYSPFLCGVGLMESLELGYLVNMMIWDRMPEPFLLVHLHNMLVQKGYVAPAVGLFASLEDIFPTTFFVDGKKPVADFDEALTARIGQTGGRRAHFERRGIRRNATRSAVDIHGLLDLSANRIFTTKSSLVLYRQAEWDLDRIPDAEVPWPSLLALSRLACTKQITDPLTGAKTMQETDIVKRARAAGIKNAEILRMASSVEHLTTERPVPAEILDTLPEGYSHSRMGGPNTSPLKKNTQSNFPSRDLLTLVKRDVHDDVCGTRPLSSLNLVWVTSRFLMLFMQIEERLKELRNPLWVETYERPDSSLKWEKRVALVVMALNESCQHYGREECLAVMAEMFEEQRMGWMQHIYWDDLATYSEPKGQANEDEEPGDDACVLM